MTRRRSNSRFSRTSRARAPTVLQLLPHHGLTRFLDSQNLRHRFPGIYARLIGSGDRDAAYAAGRQEVV